MRTHVHDAAARVRRRGHHAIAAVIALLVGALLAGLSAAPAVAEQPRVYALQIDGVISPLTAEHVQRILSKAQREGASALLARINSPGGNEAAVRAINQSFLTSTIPVVVYVGPQPEAQALSGAMFVTIAGHLAAMAPDTTIGAPLPPGLADRQDDPERAERIARALTIATTAAQARGRDVDAVARVVEQEEILTARDALREGIIDEISPDVESLLASIHGTDVDTLLGPTTLATENARVVWTSMTLRETVLQRITDPNIAYVLFALGITLLLVELYNPGRLIAGVPAVIALAAAFIAFGNLPVSWLGLALMIASVVLFIRELYTPRLGLLGPLGLLCFVAGSLTLYRPVRQTSAVAAAVAVNIWVVLVTTLVLAGVLLLIMRAIFRVRRGETLDAAIGLVGAEGIVIQPLQPRGVVRVLSQEWAAFTDGPPIEVGAHVRVAEVRGGMLRVEPFTVDLVPETPTQSRQSS